jgi:anaphase-promoting complex subunit 2
MHTPPQVADIQTSLHPLVISHRFWPPVPSTTLQLPPKLASAQQAYEDAFHHFKPDKHLLFYQHLGTVTLNLEMADRTLQVEATALQAAVLEHMEGQVEWHVSQLADTLQTDEDAVHSALQFWAEEGVVQEQEGGSWIVLEYAETEE